MPLIGPRTGQAPNPLPTDTCNACFLFSLRPLRGAARDARSTRVMPASRPPACPRQQQGSLRTQTPPPRPFQVGRLSGLGGRPPRHDRRGRAVHEKSRRRGKRQTNSALPHFLWRWLRPVRATTWGAEPTSATHAPVPRRRLTQLRPQRSGTMAAAPPTDRPRPPTWPPPQGPVRGHRRPAATPKAACRTRCGSNPMLARPYNRRLSILMHPSHTPAGFRHKRHGRDETRDETSV